MHCITFAFSQHFMHYSCVFSMLEPCVLIGLNWTEPMMIFLLHVTWSCIIHAFVPFFSLSLSLSLSLCDSLRMAPKRKSTPSRNPLRSGASSSSDSTPLHVRLRDEKARQDFSKNFSKRGIHSEHHVILSASPILIYQLSFTGGDGSLFVRSRWVVPPWSYRSFTPIYTDSIILYLVSSLLFEVSI